MDKFIFTREYVSNILSPFVGLKLRMLNDGRIPFSLETALEAPFQIRTDNIGISFILSDSFYIKRDLRQLLNNSLHDMGIKPFTLDKLLDEDTNGKTNILFNRLVEQMQQKFEPQIAFTHYSTIKSLAVNSRGFALNGIEFHVTSH